MAVLLGLMFVAFLLQIVFRYFFNLPVGWTSELTVATWLWLVLWGSAFVLNVRVSPQRALPPTPDPPQDRTSPPCRAGRACRYFRRAACRE